MMVNGWKGQYLMGLFFWWELCRETYLYLSNLRRRHRTHHHLHIHPHTPLRFTEQLNSLGCFLSLSLSFAVVYNTVCSPSFLPVLFFIFFWRFRVLIFRPFL